MEDQERTPHRKRPYGWPPGLARAKRAGRNSIGYRGSAPSQFGIGAPRQLVKSAHCRNLSLKSSLSRLTVATLPPHHTMPCHFRVAARTVDALKTPSLSDAPFTLAWDAPGPPDIFQGFQASATQRRTEICYLTTGFFFRRALYMATASLLTSLPAPMDRGETASGK